MNPVIYALIGLMVFFFLLVVLGFFVYVAFVIMRSLKELRDTIKSATEALNAIAPLLKGEDLTRMLNAYVVMGKLGRDMIEKMEAVNRTISLFYNFAVATNEMRPVGPGGGRFGGSTDEDAAAREAAQKGNAVEGSV